MDKKKRKILVTSALPYANGSIHLGHLVEYIQTDIWVRFQNLYGNKCIYVCADDAHGTPIMLSAKKQGISPETLINDMQKEHIADFDTFGIKFDNYYSTHSKENQKLVEFIYNKAQEADAIYNKEIEQYFCEKDQMFLPDRLIKGVCPFCKAEDQYGDACEKCSQTYSPTQLENARCAVCGSKPVLKKSNHYFFQLSKFEENLKKWIKEGHVSLATEHKLLEWFDAGLRDWDISRDAPYFGFQIPGTKEKYFYVWLDAPIGYMASTQNWCDRTGENFKKIWNLNDWEIHHFIGKDILYFHTLFWPAMLQVAGFNLPTKVNVHGFLTVQGQKMSKSRGTFIRARDYSEKLNPEYLRYYYATKLNNTAEDLDLNFEDFVYRINSDVVNKFVNIASRLGKIVNKKLDGKISVPDKNGEEMLANIRSIIETVASYYENLEYGKAMRDIMLKADVVNKYIDKKIPWDVVKTDKELARVICTTGLNAVRILAGLLKPIIPKIVAGLEEFLNCDELNFKNIYTDIANIHINEYRHLAERLDLGKFKNNIFDH